MSKHLRPPLLVLFGTLVALLLAELMLFVFKPQPLLRTSAEGIFFMQPDPELGWRNTPGAEGPYQPYPELQQVRIRINERGFRGPAWGERTDGKRIAVLGDSNTFGYGVQEARRFSDLLDVALGDGVQVLNLGVFGYGTDQQVLLYRELADDLAADIVVLAVSAGDVNDNMSSVNGGFAKPFFELVSGRLELRNTPVPVQLRYLRRDQRTSAAQVWLYEHSHLFRAAMFQLNASREYMDDSLHEMDREKGTDVTVALIETLAGEVRSRGGTLVVLLIPHEVWVEGMVAAPDAPIGYYHELARRLGASGIAVLDVTSAMVDVYREGGKLFLVNDPVHLDEVGNALAAEYLGTALSMMGLVEDSP